MLLRAAQTILHTATRCARGTGRLYGLLDELSLRYQQGRVVDAEEVGRTIDDLAGHWMEGRFVGYVQIAEASRTCREARS